MSEKTIKSNASDNELKQEAFEIFSELHPHEAFAQHPMKFWKYFHSKNPTVSRERMIELLETTSKP